MAPRKGREENDLAVNTNKKFSMEENDLPGKQLSETLICKLAVQCSS